MCWCSSIIEFQEEALHLRKRKIKLMEDRLMKSPKPTKNEVYMHQLSLIPFIKKLDDIPRLELRIEFLNSVTRRIQICKNRSPPFKSVSAASNSSCPPTPSPRAASLGSTHSRNSDTQRIHRDVLYLKRRFTVRSVSRSIMVASEGVTLLQTKKIVLPVPST